MGDAEEAIKEGGRKIAGRVRAAVVAYPVAAIIIFLIGRWTAWIPLLWGL